MLSQLEQAGCRLIPACSVTLAKVPVHEPKHMTVAVAEGILNHGSYMVVSPSDQNP